MRKAFVTGCATGFGHLLAKRLLAQGWHVVATDPTVEGWPQALGAPRSGLEVHALDVRDPEAVSRVAEAVGDVDLLVNNAGFALFATQEEGDLDAVRDMFDVNVFGVMRVTQALLPGLRRRHGTIVQISSVAGRTSFPESGFYAATKHAVEAVSEALVQEVGPLGVRVRIVEPGSFDTQFLTRAAQVSSEPPAGSPYAGLRPGWALRRTEVLEAPQPPSMVVDAIVASLEDPAPARRLVVGPDSARILGLRNALGPDAWLRLVADRAGLARGPHEAGELPGPSELLAMDDDDPRWDLVLLAYEHRHLEHWSHEEPGRQALRQVQRRWRAGVG